MMLLSVMNNYHHLGCDGFFVASKIKSFKPKSLEFNRFVVLEGMTNNTN